jgi:hypothetical protein
MAHHGGRASTRGLARSHHLTLLIALLGATAVTIPASAAEEEEPTAAAADVSPSSAEATPAEAADVSPSKQDATPAAAEDADKGEKAEREAKKDKPDEVVVGAYLNDVQSLDLKTHTFAADIYLWFRWQNTDIDPITTLEFLNPSELWGHTRTNDYEKPEELADGLQYNVLHLQGRFSCKLPLFDYPFDQQVLFLEFEDSNLAANAMRYVPDTVPIKVNPKLKLPGYEIGEAKLVVSRYQYETNFGDPRVKGHDAFSRGRVELHISRPILPHAIKMLLPVLCVVLCASMMFILSPQYVDSRVELGITSLLTVVALQMSMNDNLPEVAYLVLIDKVYLATYLFVIFGFVLVVREAKMVDAGNAAGAEKLNRRGLGLGSLVYLSTVAVLILPTVLGR